MIDAVIPVWKPIDWTSFDVVKKIRGQIKPAKVGHAGTLDPFAEGVLMLCAGKYTKKVESFMDKEKEYSAEIQLGIETDTLDPTGKIVKTSNVPHLTEDKIKGVLNKFTGKIKQMPPMYSALKVNGQPLYKSARKGINIDRKMRTINIYEIVLINFTNDTISLKVTCGRGTYIRSLAKDIAAQLNTVGHLSKLIRTRIGEFDENSCVELKDFPKWLSART
ncbi:MAG: tRNA pseudouridine(55) synthase TruB [Candidatus Marinimicrobia bacterium]|jgi:tRNA pseudouridine55 synthase|nr:tRNA pseudouridine(55) synthase TruB [Candidatus Neomarinimicrobiota bacterium]